MPCQQFSVEAEVQDESVLEISDYTLASDVPEQVTADIVVKNVIKGGDGQTLSGTVNITTGDGKEYDSYGVSVPPGGTVDETRQYDPVEPGERKFCVEVV